MGTKNRDNIQKTNMVDNNPIISFIALNVNGLKTLKKTYCKKIANYMWDRRKHLKYKGMNREK